LTVRGGESRYVTTLPDVIGVLAIVPDQIFFIRGDSNADAAIDSSDAIFTLGFLFLGGAEPLCLDAADANDDGRLDISDAVSTLAYLYVGQISTLPAPFPSAGGDPTPDGLDCAQGAL
jgi:hypothetical protein